MKLESFRKAYDTYFRLARKVAMDILHDYYLAGDVAQEVFTEMFQKKYKFDDKKIKYWIVLNTGRRAKDYQRKSFYKNEVLLSADNLKKHASPSGFTMSTEELILRREEVAVRLDVLEELKEHNSLWYHILIGYHVDGESYANLAATYEMTVGNVRMQASRARKWLDKRFEERYW